MNLLSAFEILFQQINLSVFVLREDGKTLFSTTSDNEFTKNVFKAIEDGNNVLCFKDKFYSCGTFKFKNKLTFCYAQDVSKTYEELGKDKLTKLYNRVMAFPMIDEYVLHCFEKEESFSVIMCDIDHFKNLNDTYGHDKGDEALADTGRVLLNNFRTRDKDEFLNVKLGLKGRPKDILCRYGGEEFLIVVKNINLENTIRKIETIREIVEERGILTMSFGVANFDPKNYEGIVNKENISEERDKMIKIADICLYNSKNNGRNQLSYYDQQNDEIKSNIGYTK